MVRTRVTYLIIILLVISNVECVQAQTGVFTDRRDGNTYQTITIGKRVWLRENLRFKTSLSFFPNVNKDTSDLKYGNYYSYNEMNTICPEGWHVATIKEFEEYLHALAVLNNIPDSSIIRTTQQNRDSAAHISIGGLNPFNDTLLNFPLIGWVEGKKVENKKSVTIWLADTHTNDDKFHAHIGSLGYFIHTHLHNVIDKPKRVRKFTVRCVCEVKPG